MKFDFKKNKDIYEVNSKLEKELKVLVKKIYAKQYREDALDVLKRSDEKTIKDFLFFALSDNGNLACMAVDFAKDKDGNKIGEEKFGKYDFDL